MILTLVVTIIINIFVITKLAHSLDMADSDGYAAKYGSDEKKKQAKYIRENYPIYLKAAIIHGILVALMLTTQVEIPPIPE